jgi:hypothetical protein
MMERTLHLVGLWIGAAISNMSHSKPVLPLPTKHGLQIKDEGRRQCCHTKHIKFPIGLHMMYLYFPETPHIFVNQMAAIALSNFSRVFL